MRNKSRPVQPPDQVHEIFKRLGISPTPDDYYKLALQLSLMSIPKEYKLTIPNAETWNEFKDSLLEAGRRAWKQHPVGRGPGRPGEQKRYMTAINEILAQEQHAGHLRWPPGFSIPLFKESKLGRERKFSQYRLTQLMKSHGLVEATSAKYARLWFCSMKGTTERPSNKDLAFLKQHAPYIARFLEVWWQTDRSPRGLFNAALSALNS
jgi:hypothetical protein